MISSFKGVLSNYRVMGDGLVKYGAALGFAALAAAFLYDTVFWCVLDRRMLTFFVLADHIQTAVFILGIVVVLSAALALYGLIFEVARYKIVHLLAKLAPRPFANPRYAHGLSLCVIIYCLLFGVLYASGSRLHGPLDWSLVLLIGLMAGLAGYVRGPKLVPPADLDLSPSLVIPLAMVVIGALAWTSAIVTRRPLDDVRDRVIFELNAERKDNAELSGRIVRYLDRGLIMFDEHDDKMKFIPRDSIREVDATLHDRWTLLP